MKKQITVAALLFFAVAVQSQPPQQTHKPPTVEERLKKTNEILQHEVQLNTTQKKAVETVFKNFFNAADKLHKDNPPPPSATPSQKVKEAMDKLVLGRDEAIKNILTADQYIEYKEATKKMHPPKPPGKNEPPPPHQ